MSPPSSHPPGDVARASVLVSVTHEEAFRVFTEDIDAWWRRGPKYRVSGRHRGILRLEPRVDGRLIESFETASGPRTVETGRVTLWQPPERLAFEWRAVNFAPHEKTCVDVRFEPHGSGTLVTVTHSGWSEIPPDHPVRHGKDIVAFIRMMGLSWGDLLSSFREHAGER